MDKSKPKLWLYGVLFVLGAGPLIGVLTVAYLTLPGLLTAREPNYNSLSLEEREQVYARLAEQVGGVWDSVPEPKVGRMLQRNIKKTYAEALLVSNSAGLRDEREYVRKDKNTFRIVLLGDSFVMGSAGPEEDRLGTQMEAMLRDIYGTIGGKNIEVYSVGLSSWNMVAEATYLSSRLSAYRPDIIIAILTLNDITDNMGVSGVGGVTQSFSPARRDLGSGVLSYTYPRRFGATGTSLLLAGLGPTSEEYWLEAMGAMKALEALQSKRGGKMLMSSLNLTTPGPTLFRENLVRFYRQLKFASPYIPVCYFVWEGNRLPHNAHPNRAGYRILTSHYLHVLAKLGWIPESDSLPALDPRLSLDTSPSADPERLRLFQLDAIADLKSRLDFSDLDKIDLQSMLGGFLPGVRAGLKYTLKRPPFGTLRTIFLLRNEGDATEAYVTIQVPSKMELFPLNVSLYVQGKLGDSLTVESLRRQTNYTLRAPSPESKRGDPAIEIKLLADRYWSKIDRRDEGMRSYRLIEAGLE